MSPPGACDPCLRRTWLVDRLAGWIELARRERRVLRELLALSDDRLLEVVGGAERARVEVELEALDPGALRRACAEAGLVAACRHDQAYPDRLRAAADAPAVLHVAGHPERLEALVGGDLQNGPRAVAVVGTRRASSEGLEVARALGRGLAAGGVTVVSGMALGIDSAAHAGALDAGGRTVAVLAAGADRPYPSSKRALHRRIVAAGCVVSELPPGASSFRWCFPARNRIIAALGHMTVVVEAAERSGSLITAECAADLGRDVGAVPGPVTAWRSRGTNALIKDGAVLVRDARDALEVAVGIEALARVPVATSPEPAAAATLDARLRSILRAVGDGRDSLAALAGTPDQAQATLTALTELELLGLIRRAPGGRYVVVPP